MKSGAETVDIDRLRQDYKESKKKKNYEYQDFLPEGLNDLYDNQ